MEDWEKRNFLDRQNQEIGRQNDLLEEKNRLAKEQNETLRQSNLDAEWREERYRREQREIEDVKRIERFEKEMDDRIYKLKLDIAKTKDETIKYELQGILDEEIQKRNNYYQDKELERQANLEENRRNQENAKRKARRRKIISFVKRMIFLAFILLMSFIALALYMASRKDDSSNNSFKQENASSSSLVSEVNNEASSSTHTEVSNQGVPFKVSVTVNDLNIRQSASSSAKIVGICPKGTYTIVETKSSDGYTWGRLKSGKGWIALEHTEKLNSESKVESGEISGTEWERPYHHYYVASSSSTLMMAGFKLESNGKVTLYRAGAEIMAANSGNPVEGTYTVESYNSTEQVTSFEITQRTIVNGDIPNTKKILPNVIIRIHVPAEELQKAGEPVSVDQNLIYYGYYSYLGQHILTDGNSSGTPQVFFHMGE